MDQSLINRIVEAALLAAHQPLTLAQLHALFPEDQPAPAGSVEQAIETLQAGCAERGVELVELASGFRFQVKGDVHAWVARLWTERQTRYTRATLETLALIAYRQPITRGEIEQVRGVAVNSNIIKALEEREWIRVVGHRDVPGKPALFGTTKAFLDYFGLKRLDELPPLSELKEIGELEPQFKFDGEAGDKPAPSADAAIDAGGLGAGNAQAANDADGDAEDARDGAGEHTHDADAGDDTSTVPHHPEAAPGERAADENEQGSAPESDDAPSAIPEADGDDDVDPAPASSAVETTTVPESEAASEEDAPEQLK
ncbi:SMC-Scp complex subunit ScpB [Lysobacter aestuarii]|uniref:SMC-Scp complex subunit ScpB n=1 Tax=Marilutibacter aestuarii TaxID=1706195 RepID=A0A507ZXR3_9GAMM|nr:SMC-Scp complex subunit ScpB [Lysobacter aestuarii]TQD41044.1 SMC-Scp complex subunit ScpB [Lysobacter aestuarii]